MQRYVNKSNEIAINGYLHDKTTLNLYDIQGRLVLNEDEKIRAKKLGIKDFNKKYNIDDMVKGDVIFCATGVTSGDLAIGVKDLGNEFEVNSFALHKSQNIIKKISNIYNK